jgi:hypothetical protein
MQNEFRTVETRGVDTNESYYEVPHWMHLSFISYDREESQTGDHVEPANGASSKVLKNTGLDSYEVGPNGFLRPKPDPDSNDGKERISSLSKPKSPSSSFSAVGNIAATPVMAKSTQERQLISGRDFRDILEACRPRVLGMRIPSSLLSILKLQKHADDLEKARLSGVQLKPKKSSRDDKHTPLREWGTVDFSEYLLHPKAKSSKNDSPTFRKSPTEGSGYKSDNSESGSNSSSFTSHVSSMFGMSYDRVLWDHYDSPATATTAIQIQRSPSMEFDKLNTRLALDAETAVSEDSMSLGTNASSSSGGKASPVEGEADWFGDNDTNTSQLTKAEKHVETLRSLMEAHDIQVCAPQRSSKADATGDTNLTRPDSIRPSESDLNIASKAGNRSQSL